MMEIGGSVCQVWVDDGSLEDAHKIPSAFMMGDDVPGKDVW